MGINSTEVSYGFGQMGSAFSNLAAPIYPPKDHVIVAIQFLADNTPTVLETETLDGMVIVAITMIGVTAFDKLTADTSNSVVYGGTESNNVYFGITNGNTGGNSEAVDASISFPAGMTIYGRWSVVSLNAADTDGGIIAYFGY